MIKKEDDYLYLIIFAVLAEKIFNRWTYLNENSQLKIG